MTDRPGKWTRVQRAPRQALGKILDATAGQLLRRPQIMALVRRGVRQVPALERLLISYFHTRRHAGDETVFWKLDPDPTALQDWVRLLRIRSS